MVTNSAQDFADRYYKYCGGRQHFGYLTKMAKIYGVDKCEQVLSSIKHDGIGEKIGRENIIKYFNKAIHG